MKQTFASLALLMLAAGLSGCGSTKPSRYYTLQPLAEPTEEPLDLAIGVGPIEVPKYLDKRLMATTVGKHELAYAQYSRWAERLPDSLISVLQENIGSLLGTDRVVQFPWVQVFPLDYWVVAQVTRFEIALKKDVTLSVRWIIYGENRHDIKAVKTSTYSELLLKGDYAEAAAAHSRMLARLSSDIAEEIRTLHNP